MSIYDLPAVNGSLNGLSTIFLSAGYFMIKRKKISAHRNCMIAAFVTSTLFLACYLTYHIYLGYVLKRGPTSFVNPAWFRPIYLTILISHTILAVVIVPLIFITLSRALKERFDKHKVIARWTWPLWMYVSVTGVIIYLLLYQIFPQPVPAPKSATTQGSNLPTKVLIVLPSERPAALACTALMTAPMSFLPVAPNSWMVARTSDSNSSGGIAFGKKVSSTTISAFSLAASSARPPFSNCSTESRRFFTSFCTIATTSASARASVFFSIWT